MTVTGAAAFKRFLDDVDAGTKGDKRLYFDGKTLNYDENAGYWRLFLACFNVGEAAFTNVIGKISREKHYKTYFPDQDLVTRINNFIITRYNSRQCCSEIELVSANAPAPKPGSPPPAGFANYSEYIAQLHTAYKAIKSEADVPALTEACQNLALMISLSDEKISQGQADEILAFKNLARATMFPKDPKKDRPLKGIDPKKPPKMINHGTPELRQALKELEKATLCSYFKEELEKATTKVETLQGKLDDIWANQDGNKPILNQENHQFLTQVLADWRKKIARGVIPAIPKWYHATPDENIVGKILKKEGSDNSTGCILFTHLKARRGCFLANIPATTEGYGDFCIAMTDDIERTGLGEEIGKPTTYPYSDGSDKGYPIISKFNNPADNPIRFSDNPEVFPRDLKCHQTGVKIWIGFQKGSSTLREGTHGLGKDGIRIDRNIRIQEGGTEYRKTAHVAHLFTTRAYPNINALGKELRYKVYTQDESNLIRKLIGYTYNVTLPAAYKDKVSYQYV